jgi:hypothetical protein
MVGVKTDGKGGFRKETRLLSDAFSEGKPRTSSIYPESIRFGRVRSPNALPDLVAMSASGVVIATKQGGVFDPPEHIRRLGPDGEAKSAWDTKTAAEYMLLVDLAGVGSLDIVLRGKTGLLFARYGEKGFSALEPLLAADEFNYWSSPQLYTSLDATQIAGKDEIAGRTLSESPSPVSRPSTGGRPSIDIKSFAATASHRSPVGGSVACVDYDSGAISAGLRRFRGHRNAAGICSLGKRPVRRRGQFVGGILVA